MIFKIYAFHMYKNVLGIDNMLDVLIVNLLIVFLWSCLSRQSEFQWVLVVLPFLLICFCISMKLISLKGSREEGNLILLSAT